MRHEIPLVCTHVPSLSPQTCLAFIERVILVDLGSQRNRDHFSKNAHHFLLFKLELSATSARNVCVYKCIAGVIWKASLNFMLQTPSDLQTQHRRHS